MMVYDYSNLLKAVRDTKTNKIIAENEKTVGKKNTLARLENDLKSSGLLDDWYDLKRVCRETGIRIMPYGDWDETKRGPLMNDLEYFDDNGMFVKIMSSGSHWCDSFGFSYKNREFKWKILHTTSPSLFNGFDDENYEIDTKIHLIETFMNRYEEYRSIQLQRIYAKLGKTLEETEKIKKEISSF